ncbi:MAG: hypothetical protein LBG28_02375, partial [Tannerella sp.]|nr:hypothetical protein [Tannerella sp.]
KQQSGKYILRQFELKTDAVRCVFLIPRLGNPCMLRSGYAGKDIYSRRKRQIRSGDRHHRWSGKHAILTVTERQTGFLLMRTLPKGKNAKG